MRNRVALDPKEPPPKSPGTAAAAAAAGRSNLAPVGRLAGLPSRQSRPPSGTRSRPLVAAPAAPATTHQSHQPPAESSSRERSPHGPHQPCLRRPGRRAPQPQPGPGAAPRPPRSQPPLGAPGGAQLTSAPPRARGMRARQ